MAKNKYLEFREKPFNRGEWVANINVTHMSKKEIDVKQAEIERTIFPKEKYACCLTTTSDMRDVWMDAPPKPTWEEVMEKWGGWNSAPGYMTVQEFSKYLDENFETPQKK